MASCCYCCCFDDLTLNEKQGYVKLKNDKSKLFLNNNEPEKIKSELENFGDLKIDPPPSPVEKLEKPLILGDLKIPQVNFKAADNEELQALLPFRESSHTMDELEKMGLKLLRNHLCKFTEEKLIFVLALFPTETIYNELEVIKCKLLQDMESDDVDGIHGLCRGKRYLRVNSGVDHGIGDKDIIYNNPEFSAEYSVYEDEIAITQFKEFLFPQEQLKADSEISNSEAVGILLGVFIQLPGRACTIRFISSLACGDALDKKMSRSVVEPMVKFEEIIRNQRKTSSYSNMVYVDIVQRRVVSLLSGFNCLNELPKNETIPPNYIIVKVIADITIPGPKIFDLQYLSPHLQKSLAPGKHIKNNAIILVCVPWNVRIRGFEDAIKTRLADACMYKCEIRNLKLLDFGDAYFPEKYLMEYVDIYKNDPTKWNMDTPIRVSAKLIISTV